VAAVRFLADASLNHNIVAACLRAEPALDFLSAVDADLEGMPDEEVLALAAVHSRILVTHDLKTMPHYFGDFVQSGRGSPGVFLVSQRRAVSAVAEALVLVWAASEASEWTNRILEIPPQHPSTRVRRNASCAA
jgi:Domain of unknown function (DUF5615)